MAKSLTTCREGKVLRMRRSYFFSLPVHVPEHIVYRRLKQQPNLDFLYELTEEFFGRCGQQSIDPIVFFILCLVDYLVNRSTTASHLTENLLRTAASGWTCFSYLVISSMSRCHGIPPFPVASSSCQRHCLSTYLVKSLTYM